MQANNGEYWMAFRSSNYQFTTDYRTVLTHGQKVRNKTFIGRLDPRTWMYDESTIKELDFTQIRPFTRGVEDPRLFWNGKNYCISATILEPDIPVARICVLTLESLESAKVIAFEVLAEYSADRVEKNWMPVHKTGRLSKSKADFIYSPNLLVTKKGFTPTSLTFPLNTLRGGSQVLSLGDSTSVAVVHEAKIVYQDGLSQNSFAALPPRRQYVHRFVRFDEKFTIFQMSKPFVFVENGIEFASGLTMHDDKFIISFGRSDVMSYIATVGLGQALIQMKDLT